MAGACTTRGHWRPESRTDTGWSFLFQTHIRFFAEVEITDTEGKTESGRSEIYVSGIAPEKTPEKNWIGSRTGDPFYALRFS